MRFKYFVMGSVAVLLIGVSVVFGRTSPNKVAIDDFMMNSDTSKPALLVSLYNRNLIRNVVAFNTILGLEKIKALFLKGVGVKTSQDLANPFVRYVKINEGLRKEQVVEKVGEVLGWDSEEKDTFTEEVSTLEGKLFPQTYLVPDNIDAQALSDRMLARFNQQIAGKVLKTAKKKTDTDTVLKIASLIQREAGGKDDMKLISGIIWNRLNKKMNLQIDATLQYAKGNQIIGWWPKVFPEDKYIDSPFNTYKNNGLPPAPIANPGLDAIIAAANPQSTSCIFYFHDAKKNIHCSKTYSEHVAKIKKYL
jgi:uncharacterized YceG family protein